MEGRTEENSRELFVVGLEQVFSAGRYRTSFRRRMCRRGSCDNNKSSGRCQDQTANMSVGQIRQRLNDAGCLCFHFCRDDTSKKIACVFACIFSLSFYFNSGSASYRKKRESEARYVLC